MPRMRHSSTRSRRVSDSRRRNRDRKSRSRRNRARISMSNSSTRVAASGPGRLRSTAAEIIHAFYGAGPFLTVRLG